MKEPMKVYSKEYPKLYLNVTPGHFASDRFHINYYIDMTSLKMRQINAKEVAKAMSKRYVRKVDISGNNRLIDEMAKQMAAQSASVSPADTIISIDGRERLAAHSAQESPTARVHTTTQHHSCYVITPEFDRSGQMIVRENIAPMIKGRHVLVILATAMSGRTISKSIRCITSYGGIVEGISVIFSNNVNEIDGHRVYSIFDHDDLPDFKLSLPEECEDCQNNVPLDAIVNSYGYEKL